MSDSQDDAEGPQRKFARGGLVEGPVDGESIVFNTGCVIKGYCPTHDGRLIAIRDGRFKDVTEEAIEARLPPES